MMRLLSFSTAVALAIVTTPVAAQMASENPTEAVAKPPVETKKVCHFMNATGSYISKRVCLTKAEWKELDQANQSAVNAMLDRKAPNKSLLEE